MDQATAIVLRLDLKHLADSELEWLHELNSRIQKRMIRQQLEESRRPKK